MKSHEINRRTAQYKLWRANVYASDGWTCRICGEKAKRIEAHHIKPIRTNPELALNVKNGITLCFKCHRLIAGKENQVAELLTALKANGVNSVKLSTLRQGGDNTEPSLTGNGQEGRTTRGRVFRIEQFVTRKVKCADCDKVMLRHYYRFQRSKNFFCSRVCEGSWKARNLKGNKNPNWKEKPKSKCLQCGKITRTPSDPKRKKKYCGNSCQLKYEYSQGLKRLKPYLNGRWTKKFASCVKCGTTEKRHYGRGLCSTCYQQ